jgi:hypothetical protein
MKKMLIISGYLFSVAMTIHMYITFLLAFFSPSKIVRVSIDAYGEANIEFIVLLPTMLICVIGLILLLREDKK